MRDARSNVVAVNRPCTPLYGGLLAPAALPLNLARLVFLDERAVQFLLEWDVVADDTAAALRIQAGRNPDDRQLCDLIGELATRSDAFAARWARHNVRLHRTATKRLHTSSSSPAKTPR